MSATEVQTDRSRVDDAVSWPAMTAEAVCRELDVDPPAGLQAAEVERRRGDHGAG